MLISFPQCTTFEIWLFPGLHYLDIGMILPVLLKNLLSFSSITERSAKNTSANYQETLNQQTDPIAYFLQQS